MKPEISRIVAAIINRNLDDLYVNTIRKEAASNRLSSRSKKWLLRKARGEEVATLREI